MRTIVCGTGRSGTVSLAELLDGCPNIEAIHEPRPILPWNQDKTMYLSHKSKFDENQNLALVAYYYRQYLEYFLEDFSSLKVICLKRNREDTIDSYMRKTGKSSQFPKGRNHWIKDEENWNPNPTWDKAFPNYKNIERKEDAIRQYWEDYYQYASWLQDAYPERFKIFTLDVLNEKESQVQMFDFLELDNPNFNVGIRRNKSK